MPSSVKSSYATVDVTVKGVPTSQKTLVMSAGTIFTTTVDSVSYNFVTIGDETATSENGTFEFTDIRIYEGTRVRYTYTVNSSNLEQQFVIPSAAVDTGTIVTSVQASSSDVTTEVYTLNTDYTTLTPTTLVYFLQEIEDGKYCLFNY